MGQTIDTEPQLIATTDDPAKRGYIERFDAAISERPADFVAALERLGEVATANTMDLAAANDGALPLAVTEEDFISTYFARRLDRLTTYDTATEHGLDTDPSFKELIEKHLEQTNTLAKVGKMTTIHVASPNAESKFNAVRRASLAYFLGRAAAWHAQQSSNSLPSTG
jgi:hypothetical protein